jgi:transmembrane sensor
VKTKPSQPMSGGSTPPVTRIDPLDWIGESGAQPDILVAMDRQLKQRRRRRIRTAIGTAAALLVAALIWQAPWTSSVSDGTPSAVVRVPEKQVLPDGSIVELKEGAAIKVAFSDAFRRVELLKGEAHFQVTKNPAVPFVVAVGSVEIRAIGTAFAVDRRQTQVEVLVTEGKVAVDQVNDPATANPATGILPRAETIATMTVGDRTVVELTAVAAAPAPQVEALQATEVKELLAWRVPRLEFSGTPLGEAVPMINRYSKVHLVLGDSSLESVRLSGVLRADNIETLRELLAEQPYGIKSEFRSDTEIVLTKAR